MRTRTVTLLAAMLAVCSVAWGQKQWSLDECIRYAQDNNINVQQNQLSIESSEISVNTSRGSRLPSLNASLGSGINFGRGQTRTGTYQDNTQLSGSLGLSTSMSLYEGGRIKYQIASSKLDLDAARQNLAMARENVALNITSLYLQVLFSKELLAVAENQAALSKAQAERSKYLFDSGRSAESAVYESESLAASDQLSLTQQKNNLMLALLDLSQALNFVSAEGFDVVTPAFNELQVSSLGVLPSINSVYDYSVDNRPAILVENLKLKKSDMALRISKSSLLPSVSMSAGYSSGVYHSFAGGAINREFWEQLRTNAYQSISLSVNIPIFNRRATTNQIKSSKLSIKSQELAVTEAQINLRKQIEQAYYNALAAYDQYNSSQVALESAQTAFRYEQEKMDAGRSTLYDFNDAKTRMVKAEATLAQAKYEFIFRRKIIDFYAGHPITLEK